MACDRTFAALHHGVKVLLVCQVDIVLLGHILCLLVLHVLAVWSLHDVAVHVHSTTRSREITNHFKPLARRVSPSDKRTARRHRLILLVR